MIRQKENPMKSTSTLRIVITHGTISIQKKDHASYTPCNLRDPLPAPVELEVPAQDFLNAVKGIMNLEGK